MSIKLIIGLQNPGQAYAQTRHNAGGWFIDAIAQFYHAHFKTEKKLQAEMASLELNDTNCRLVKPMTYMNQSGLPTRAASQFYRISPHEILIAHDDLDLPPGRVKFKTGGGHGGHNGLRDIIKVLGSTEFHRLRIGIGHPGHKDLVLNYVLGKPSVTDRQSILSAIDKAVDALPLMLDGEFAKAMNQLHG